MLPASPVPELTAETEAPLSIVIRAARTLMLPPVPLASLSVKRPLPWPVRARDPVAFTVSVPPPDPAGAGPFIIRVYASSSSAGAPGVQNGGKCAQAIASVLAAGFQLFNVTNSTYGPQYTLIK